MTNTVLIKRSSTANSVPVAGNLQTGELAINYTDGNLFYKDNNNGVQLLTSNKFVSVTGNITGANLNATGLSLSGNVVSNVNVTSNIAGGNIKTPGLISAAGNITGNYFIGNGSQLTGITTSAGSAITNGTSDVTVSANSNITANVSGTTIATFASTGEYVTGIISATGNVTGNFFIGNGSLLTGISSSSYGNANVAANLAVFGTNPISTSGNITGNYFIGDGSQLTGIVSSYGNANVAANLAAFGTNPISTTGNITGGYILGNGSQLTGIVSSYGNANVAANLAVFGTNPISTSGNITAGNILGGSNVNATTHTGTTVSVTGNITGGNVNAAGLSLSGNVVSALNLTANVTTTANISGSYILGNGSQLTGLPVTYANANVAANLAAFGTNPISTGGNITGGNFYVPTTNTGLIGGVIGLTYAGYFNGTNQYLTVPNATVLAGAGNLTIEFWAYPMNSSGRCFIGGTDWELYMSGWEVRFVQQNSYGFNSGLNVTPDTWNHVVLSRDSFVSGTSGNWRIFVNGVMYTTASNGGSPLSSPSYLGIGISVDNGGTRNPFEGYLSNFRIVNGVGVYTSAFTPSTTPLTPNQLANVNGSPSAALTAGQTKLLTLQNSTIIDNSSQALTITNYNTVVTSTSSVLVTSAQGTLIYDGSTWQSTSIMVTGTLSATGNVTGNYFIGNGSQLTGIAASYGNANVAANLAAFGTNPVSTTGNITAGNILGGANVNATTHTGTTVSVSANVTGGNILTGGIVSATGNVTGNFFIGNGSQLTGLAATYGNANVAANLAAFGTNPISTSGNITAGNLLTNGVISATGNITANNAIFTGNLSVAGNVTYISSNVVTINDVAINLGNNASNITQVNNGGIELGPQGSPYVTFLYNSSANTFTSNVGLSAVANITGGNVLTGGIVSATGNITGGNILGGANVNATTHTGTTVSVSANVTGGNVLTGGIVSATGNITGGNLSGTSIVGTLTTAAQTNITSVGTLGSLAVTGNATGGNVLTGGIVSATGNVTGNFFIGNGSQLTGLPATYGNANVAANLAAFGTNPISATGNITGNYFIGNGSQLTGIAPSYGNANVAANLAVFGTNPISTSGNITGGNIITPAAISAVSVSASGNVTGGNVNTNTVVGTATTIKSIGDLTLSTTGNIVVGTYINGLSTPVQDQDAATKAYVDLVAQGLHIHDSANLASTADLATYTGATVTYNNGSSGVGATLSLVGNTLTTLDGTAIPAPASTRLLIKNQGNAVQNGMYNYTSSSLLTRSTDFDTSAEAAGGDFLFVTSGATLADTGWVQTTDNPTLGTSPIVFTQFSGAGTFSANTSAGLVLNGTVFSAKTDNISTAFDGTGNIVVKASAQLTTPNIGAATGTSLSVTGNITGGNVLGGANVNATTLTGTTVSVTGNITGGNILGGANVNATTLTGATVSITGNIITGGGIVSRSVSIADGTSVTINADTTDLATQTNTQVAGILTINAPTGTLTNGQKIMFRLQSSNVQTFSWNAVFAGSTDLSLPTASSGSSKYDYVGFIYNTTATKWQILAKNFGF